MGQTTFRWRRADHSDWEQTGVSTQRTYLESDAAQVTLLAADQPGAWTEPALNQTLAVARPHLVAWPSASHRY